MTLNHFYEGTLYMGLGDAFPLRSRLYIVFWRINWSGRPPWFMRCMIQGSRGCISPQKLSVVFWRINGSGPPCLGDAFPLKSCLLFSEESIEVVLHGSCSSQSMSCYSTDFNFISSFFFYIYLYYYVINCVWKFPLQNFLLYYISKEKNKNICGLNRTTAPKHQRLWSQ
jgi:hypothetical protein